MGQYIICENTLFLSLVCKRKKNEMDKLTAREPPPSLTNASAGLTTQDFVVLLFVTVMRCGLPVVFPEWLMVSRTGIGEMSIAMVVLTISIESGVTLFFTWFTLVLSTAMCVVQVLMHQGMIPVYDFDDLNTSRTNQWIKIGILGAYALLALAQLLRIAGDSSAKMQANIRRQAEQHQAAMYNEMLRLRDVVNRLTNGGTASVKDEPSTTTTTYRRTAIHPPAPQQSFEGSFMTPVILTQQQVPAPPQQMVRMVGWTPASS